MEEGPNNKGTASHCFITWAFQSTKHLNRNDGTEQKTQKKKRIQDFILDQFISSIYHLILHSKLESKNKKVLSTLL
jgi:hypothetical protein